MVDKKDKKEEPKNSWREELDRRQKKIEQQKELQRMNRNQFRGNSSGLDKARFTRNRRNTQGGGSTMEILIAFVVITLALSAVVMVVFGNQSLALDTKLTQRALYHAERGIEHAFASSTNNFSALASGFVSLFGGIDDVYGDEVELVVTDISECLKRVESRVSWQTSPVRDRAQALSTLFTDPDMMIALGGNCVTEEITDSWEAPNSDGSGNLIHPGGKATDIDVVKRLDGRFAILTTEKNGGHPTFWVIDVSDESNPFLLNSYTTSNDLNAVSSTQEYAFVASSDVTAQLQVFDIIDTSNPTRIATSSLPDITNGVGRSIFYYDEKVYIGTQYVACPSCDPHQNNELHIFDVSDPYSPQWEGSIAVNRNVNDIVIRNGLAYLAVGPGSAPAPYDSLRIYDISNPGDIGQVGSFSIAWAQAGTSVHILGNKLYFGLRRIPGQERPTFYILDISDPSNPVELGSKILGINPNTEVVGIKVVGNLAFVVSDDQTDPFMVYNVSNPANSILISTCSFNFSEKTTGLDVVDGLVFTSQESQEALRVIYSANSCN